MMTMQVNHRYPRIYMLYGIFICLLAYNTSKIRAMYHWFLIQVLSIST